jgi:hypothetical protein
VEITDDEIGIQSEEYGSRDSVSGSVGYIYLCILYNVYKSYQVLQEVVGDVVRELHVALLVRYLRARAQLTCALTNGLTNWFQPACDSGLRAARFDTLLVLSMSRTTDFGSIVLVTAG